jgi:hypothetical protein
MAMQFRDRTRVSLDMSDVSRSGFLATLVLLAACGGGSVAGNPRVSTDGLGGLDVPGAADGDAADGDATDGGAADPGTGGATGRGVGAPCGVDGDCDAGLFCGTFPGGYCTMACDTATCPPEGWCGTSTSGDFCYGRCGTGVCRSGYDCKADLAAVCIPKGASQVAHYASCADSSQCIDGTCLFPYCGDTRCASGFCTSTCAADGDCAAPGVCDVFKDASWCASPCAADGTCAAGLACHDGTPRSYCSP